METNVSVFAFLSVAFSTNSKILYTVLFWYSLVTCISTTAPKLMEPDSTSSCSFTSRNLLSPVKAEVSNCELPRLITPSSGIFSPCFTKIVSPTLISSGDTFSNPSAVFRFAYSGLISINFWMDLRERSTALSSNISPIS